MHETSIQSASIAHEARPCVLVVSDVILYREGVARGLELAGRHRVAATSAEDSALATLTCSHVDVVLLDASDVSALHTAQTLRDAHPTLPVVGFGICNDDASLACAEAGLRGFVGRNGSIADLIETIDRALTGEVYCSSRLAAMLCDRVALLARGERQISTSSPLTPRELEIAELVGEGLSNKEIALQLKIGPATVKNHIHSILEKLAVARRSGIAARLGILRTLPSAQEVHIIPSAQGAGWHSPFRQAGGDGMRSVRHGATR